MDDILRQNPELMKQFASAAVGSMGPMGQGPMGPMSQGPMGPMGPMAGGPPPNNRRGHVRTRGTKG